MKRCKDESIGREGSDGMEEVGRGADTLKAAVAVTMPMICGGQRRQRSESSDGHDSGIITLGAFGS